MDIQKRISTDPNVLLGKPVITGTRISVELILKKMGEGADYNKILEMYPGLEMEDVLAALQYASKIISNDLPIDSAA
jgi:uncharacterized protein (DUF433 family)